MRDRGATCRLKPTTHGRLPRHARERATTLAVSREEAHHASLSRARAVLRRLWSAYSLWKVNVPAKGLSPAVQNRGATCQLRPPLCAAGLCIARGGAPLCSLSLGSRRSTRACRARAECRADCGRFTCCECPLHEREASLRRCKAQCDVQASASSLRSWLSRGMRGRATALTVSWEQAQHASLSCVRGEPHRLWSVHALRKANAPARSLSSPVQDRGATCQ